MGLAITYGIPKFNNAVSSMGVRFRPKMGGSFGFAVSMKITGNITKSRVNLNDPSFAQDLQDDATCRLICGIAKIRAYGRTCLPGGSVEEDAYGSTANSTS